VRAILATREQVRQNMGLEEPVIVHAGHP
jgi:hypothetical protein